MKVAARVAMTWLRWANAPRAVVATIARGDVGLQACAARGVGVTRKSDADENKGKDAGHCHETTHDTGAPPIGRARQHFGFLIPGT